VLEVASFNIFIGVRIIKEMPGSVASGTHCTMKATVPVPFLISDISNISMARMQNSEVNAAARVAFKVPL